MSKKMKCECNFPFRFRDKLLNNCVKVDKKVSKCAENQCCEVLEFTSSLKVTDGIWDRMSPFNRKSLTGLYKRKCCQVNTEDHYYSHETGTFHLCINNRRTWQVIYRYETYYI